MKRLRIAAELSGTKEGAETLKWLVKLGKMHPAVLGALANAGVIEVTGWTPEELKRQSAEEIQKLQVIWGARGASTRQETKMMKGI